MQKDPRSLSDSAQLRCRAEARLPTQFPRSGQSPPSVEESLRLVHELQVHQIELELQNTAHQQTKEQLLKPSG